MLALAGRIAELLDAEETLTYPEASELLLIWIQSCDRSAHAQEGTPFNDMHVIGMGLCVALQQMSLPETTKYNLKEELGHFADRIALNETEIQDMSWQQASDIIATLQIEFNTLFDTKEGGGFACSVHIQRLLLEILRRLGFFLAHTWKPGPSHERIPSLEETNGLIHLHNDGWQSMRSDAIVHALDGLHAIATASWLILSAQPLPDSELPPVLLHAFQREASLDDFYEISTIADTPMGAISQYKHKFRHLFHSTSQARLCYVFASSLTFD